MTDWIETRGQPVQIEGQVQVKHRFGMVKTVESAALVRFEQTGSPSDVTHIRALPAPI